MPRYKVKASDGKVLTVEAPDEQALDEAMHDYETGQHTVMGSSPEAPATPGFAARAGEAVLNAIPGRPSYEAFKGNAPWEQKASAVSGDVANAAALVAAGAGAGVRGVAKMAGAGAGLNLANNYLQGLNKGAGELGGKFSQAYSKLFGYPFQNRETPSVLQNFLAQIPQAVGETAGELAPSAALLALGGKLPGALESRAARAAGPAAEAQVARGAAQELAGRGYPVTESHAVPGDVRLKEALANPALSAEREAYLAKLGGAQAADLEKTLQPARVTEGPAASASLGANFQDTAAKALKERGASYGRMMDTVGEQQPGAHAGKALNQRILADLQSKGVDVKALKSKALLGNLTEYDLKGVQPGLSAADVQAAIRFGDLASQRAPMPADLAPLASNFAKAEGLFEKGANPGALKERANRMAVEEARKAIAAKDPSLVADFDKQRANYAQGANLADERSRYMPRMDAEGQPIRSEMTSPEQVFRKDVIGRGAQGVREWKSFLQNNGQDPAILEQMAVDHLDELAGGRSGKITAQSLKSAWQQLAGGKNAELGSELFSPATRAKVESLIQRMELSEKPLQVMGTQVRGGSQTQPLGAISEMGRKFGGSATGALMGALSGGPMGAGAGAVVGDLAQRVSSAFKEGKQRSFMANAPKAVGPEASVLKRAAAQRQVAALLRSLSGGLPPGLVPAQAALSTTR